jgi:hypothetical protein
MRLICLSFARRYTPTLRLSKHEHLTKSVQNEEFAASLDPSTVVRIEWRITALFYAALHYVQAYFGSRSSIAPMTHQRRAGAIERDPLISGAYDDYRELEDLSREARYGFSKFEHADMNVANAWLTAIRSVVSLHL